MFLSFGLRNETQNEDTKKHAKEACGGDYHLGRQRCWKNQYIAKKFDQASTIWGKSCTTWASDKKKVVDINGTFVTLRIWDTAGPERFQVSTFGSDFYRCVDVCVLVFDITSSDSISNINSWMMRMRKDEFDVRCTQGTRTSCF